MKPKYATLALAPCGFSSVRSAPELLHRRLAHRVGHRSDAVDEGVDRRDHDHVALPAHDLGQRRVDRAVHAHHVHVENALEALAGSGAEGGRAHHDARVGDDHIETAEALDRGRHRALHRAAIRHVAGYAERAGVVQLCRRAAGGGLLQVDDRHRGPARDQRPRGRQADTARAARDQRRLARQVEVSHGGKLSQTRAR